MERLWAPWRMEYILAPHTDECIFCEALKKGEKGYTLACDELAFVIMNTFPYNNGHIMVAPTRHTGDLQDLSDKELLSLSRLVKRSLKVLQNTLKPDAFNIGMNLGRIAGAGVEEHVHIHIVPRWNGDTNFMPVISDTKVLSQSLDETYHILKVGFGKIKS
jgi:ATP adenylyltransferase